jgi:hypothetical protein
MKIIPSVLAFLSVSLTLTPSWLAAKEDHYEVHDLSGIAPAWSGKFVMKILGTNSASIAFVNASEGTPIVEGLFGAAGLDQSGALDPQVKRARGGTISVPGTMWEVGSLPVEYVTHLIKDNRIGHTTHIFHVNSAQYEKSFTNISAKYSSTTTYNPPSIEEKEDIALLLEGLLQDVAKATNTDLKAPGTLFAVPVDLSAPGIPYFEEFYPLLSLPDQPFDKYAAVTGLHGLVARPLSDFQINLESPNASRVIEDLGDGTSVEFVKFSPPIWSAGGLIWCYSGEVKNSTANGFAVLDLNKECDGTHTLSGEFSNGKANGIVSVIRDGGIIEHGTTRNGKKHGAWTIYSHSGVIKNSQNYSDGELAPGPVIQGNEFSPLLAGFGSDIGTQFIGVRDESGDLTGEVMPVVHRIKRPDGTNFIIKPGELIAIKEGEFTFTAETQLVGEVYKRYVVDGPCTTKHANGIVYVGNCKEDIVDNMVHTGMRGPCTIFYPDQNKLNATCGIGGIQAGLGFLTGPEIDSQYVNISDGGGYQYFEPSSWKKAVDKISNVLIEAIQLYHNPESWFDYKIWEGAGERVSAELTRVIERNDDLAVLFEAFCSDGCSIVTADFGDNVTTFESITSNEGVQVVGQTSRSPAGNIISVSTTIPNVTRPTLSFGQKASGGMKAIEWNALLLGVFKYNQSLDSELYKIRVNMAAFQEMDVTCSIKGNIVQACLPGTNSILIDTGMSSINLKVKKKAHHTDFYSEQMMKKYEQAIPVPFLPAWMNEIEKFRGSH